ncbi:MAG: isocitrate lyase/phosphoenolpyruvate mutase family protein [Proteobacteria bacterium]|nr:isocitrate lyase/phosphoenolpyruvate mutase family protein [Pseudomonadota bacterium]MCH8188244.1 isocitrate lyase/phosphoenolpyruvate mutase family protein [Pseudomonadota bacterium]
MTTHLDLPELLARPGITVVPGGGTALELRMIERAGFDAGYVSGYATAAAIYGVPDVGLIAYNEVEANVRAIRSVTAIPLIVDCDTGYGDVANVMRTVRGLEQAGAAALQFEDQQWPKKCGHMEGKKIEPEAIAADRIRAAVAARRDPNLQIIARTDARAPLGLDAALDRLRLYKEAGADVLFMDAIESPTEMERMAKELPGPLMVNMSESGKTPLMPAQDLEQLGYKIVIFPSSMIRVMIRQLGDFLAELKTAGTSKSWLGRMATLDQTNAVLGLPELNEFGERIRAA